MKLTVALALLACSQGVQVNEENPNKRIREHDTTQLGDLSTANIEVHADSDTQAKTEVDAEVDEEVDEEADADFDDADIDDEALVSELEAGDLHEIMNDPMDMFEALQSSTDAEVDEVDQKENQAILKEYQAELKKIHDFFSSMEKAAAA